MTYLPRNISYMISRMETQPRVTKQVANILQVQYKRLFQPQILQGPNID